MVISFREREKSRLERSPFRLTISGICEVCGAFSSGDLIETPGDGFAEASDGECAIFESICGDFAEKRLELGKELLDGI